jgi:hypothetical protein
MGCDRPTGTGIIRHRLWNAVAASDEAIDQASEEYDRAEQEYVSALASGG